MPAERRQAAGAAEGLPEDRRAEPGIDDDAIAALQARADEFTGPESAEMARSIAGDDVGSPIGVPDERPGRGQSSGGSNCAQSNRR